MYVLYKKPISYTGMVKKGNFGLTQHYKRENGTVTKPVNTFTRTLKQTE